MKASKKTLFVLFSISLITFLSSCSRHTGSGCPTWGKVKSEQTKQKSV